MTMHQPAWRALRRAAAIVAGAVSLLCPTVVEAQKLVLSPRHPAGGSLAGVRVELAPSLDGIRQEADSVVSITGNFAGEPLHFHRMGAYAASFGAVPVDASDSVVARVTIVHASGRADSLEQVLAFPHRPPSARERPSHRVRLRGRHRLRVDRRFTVRQDSAIRARIDRENERARDIGRAAHDVPQLWTEPFMRPRASRITSRFGTGRVFNGRVVSSHLGVDFRGHTGDPVQAANRGIVALVDSFYLAGNVVYIDHGAGVVTGYFHLSKALVAAGDTVERGQEIGLVGATGRVTGPHLHWSARYGAIVFDPSEILRVTGAPPPVRYASVRRRKRQRASPAAGGGGSR